MSSHRRRDIDGLRAIAVVPVVFFHAKLPYFSGGFLGVDVFFVISGFLITSLLLRELQQSDRLDLIKFYERRIRRISPALYFLILSSIAASLIFLTPSQIIGFSKSVFSTLLFFSNIFFWQENSYFDSGNDLKPMLHTWSLSVEEQFYLIFPIFLYAIHRYSRYLITIIFVSIIASLCLAQVFSVVKPVASFYLLPTRAFELLLGSLAAAVLVRHDDIIQRSVSDIARFCILLVALLCVIAPLIFVSETSRPPTPGMLSLMPCVGTACICVFGTKESLVSRFLALPVFAGVGLISYSLYLWHQPLFAFARIRSVNALTEHEYYVLIGIATIASVISWKFVEAPFRSKRFISSRTMFLMFAWTTLLLLSISVVTPLLNGMPGRFDIREQGLMSLSVDAKRIAQNCSGWWGRSFNIRDACILGDTQDTPPNILVYGDSHAAALSRGLDSGLKSIGRSAVQATYLGCPPFDGFERVDDKYKCQDFNDQVNSYIDHHSEIKYVIFSARWAMQTKGTGFDNGEGGVEPPKFIQLKALTSNNSTILAATLKVRKILSAGKKVILVYPIPEVGWDVPETLIKLQHQSSQISTLYSSYFNRNIEIIRAFDDINDVNLIKIRPDSIFCNTEVAGRCIAAINGVPYYYDDNHLSLPGAVMLSKLILPHLAPLPGNRQPQ